MSLLKKRHSDTETMNSTFLNDGFQDKTGRMVLRRKFYAKIIVVQFWRKTRQLSCYLTICKGVCSDVRLENEVVE
jgi:hypothetical protein